MLKIILLNIIMMLINKNGNPNSGNIAKNCLAINIKKREQLDNSIPKAKINQSVFFSIISPFGSPIHKMPPKELRFLKKSNIRSHIVFLIMQI